MSYFRNNTQVKYENRRKRKNDTPYTQMHYRTIALVGTGTSINSGGVKQFPIKYI